MVPCGGVTATGARNPWLARRILAVTHNGGEKQFPGDTLFALRGALRLGLHVLDVDVQASKDGEPVVAHDPTLDASTDGTGNISDHSADQLHRYDAGYWWVPGRGFCHGLADSAYPYRGVRTGQRPLPAAATSADEFAIPTLEEVFRRFPDTCIDIDLKPQSGAAAAVADLVHHFHREPITVLGCFDDSLVAELHDLAPTVAISPGKTAATDFYLGRRLASEFQILQVPYRYQLHGVTLTVATPELIDRAHRQGVAVWVWDEGGTPGAPLYTELAGLGVDGILAGLPSELMAVLHRLGLAWEGLVR